MNNFGGTLTKLRKEKGLTQEDLADIFQVSRQSVSKWETNSTFPETDKLISIAKYFNVSLDSLINSEKRSDVELSNAKEVIENEFVDTKQNIVLNEEKEFLQQNVKVDKRFYKRKKTIFSTLIIFFFILLIGIPILINNLGGKTYKIGDSIETSKKIEFRVNSINYPGNIGGFEAGSELTYIIIEIEMKNIGETAITITPKQFKYSNKIITQTSSNGSMTFFDNISFANEMFFKNYMDSVYGISLEANSLRKGYLVFASPRDACSNQKLIYNETFEAEDKIVSYTIALPNIS